MQPDPIIPALGGFGSFGGRFVPELLIPALTELERAHREIFPTPEFQKRFRRELRAWAGRPTPLTQVPRFSERAGIELFLKREDLLHGGAHKTNNVIGQALLAQHMGKTRLIAETGAGQHGVATAMAGARLGLEVVVFMGSRDAERQAQNVERMKLCGAEVVPVSAGSATLKDAINEALRDWATTLETTHYVLGTVCGPHPFPSLVGDLQEVIGREAKAQFRQHCGGLPDAVLACVGGGSNAMGIFRAFIPNEAVRLFGVEPAGYGEEPGEHGATLSRGRPGLLHGARTMVLQDDDGQIQTSHSAAAGLDYPGVGPEHADLQASGRASYPAVGDEDALDAFELLCKTEGIVPAFESSHALAFALQAVELGAVPADSRVIVNLSGRGDKDLTSWFNVHAPRRREIREGESS